MTLRPLAAALLAASALGLAACGGGDDETPAASSASTASEDDKTREAQVKFAECMRENGVDIPDPKPGEGQRIQVGPDSGIDPQEFEEAAKQCEEYREDIRPNLSEEQQAEFKENALEFARCMREHGVDMPDPTFSENGGVRIGGGPGSGIDRNDEDFQAAQEECGDLMGAGRQP